MESETAIELDVTGDTQATREQLALPPADGGYRAWILLGGCVLINVLIWGFAFSFGVFQEYYAHQEPFSANPNGIPTIGTVATGLMYLLAPVIFPALQRWPWSKRWCTWVSLPIVAGALVGASFAQSVSQLVAFQGVLFALGGCLLYAPTVTYLDEWFVRRKGFAIGVMWAGDGMGGVIMSLALQQLLGTYGFRITLRILAVSIVVLVAPMLMFVKPRLPTPAASNLRPIDAGFLRHPLFWILQTVNIVQGLGYFLPTNYLPTYAKSLGLSDRYGSLTVTLANAAAMFGCVSVGILVDRAEITNIILGISISAGIAVLAIWGVSGSFASLAAFSLFYGLTAGSFSTSWTGMIREVQRHSPGTDANVVFGFLAAGRGLGAVVSGPLSEALISTGSSSAKTISGYSSQYAPLIVFSGVTALFGSSGWLSRKAGFM